MADMRNLSLSAALVLTLAACATASDAPVVAQDASLGPASNTLPGYLKAGDVNGEAFLLTPPAPNSAQGRAERTVYEETRSLEGSERWKIAIQDNDLWQGGALRRFSCALGKDLGEAATPATWRMMHRIEADVRTVGAPAKEHFGRLRPLIGNDRPICVPREDWMKTNMSYPSGHSMTVWAWALILTEAAPASADTLLRVGREGGDSRVVCGVHFPSDVEAGRTVASGMVARMHADPGFLTDLARVKAEVAAAKPLRCPG